MGLNSKLHMVCDAKGTPVAMHMTASQLSNYKKFALLLPEISKTNSLLADHGYDVN